MNQEEKNIFDSLSVLWKGGWDNFNQRRNYEWKFCLSVWTAFAIFISSIVSGKLVLKSIWILLGILIVGGTITVLHIKYIAGIQRGNRLDREVASYYGELMKDMLNIKFPQELVNRLNDVKSEWGSLTNYSPLTQILITTLLYFVSILIYVYLLTSKSILSSM